MSVSYISDNITYNATYYVINPIIFYNFETEEQKRKRTTDIMLNIITRGLANHGLFGNFLLGHKLYDPRLLLFVAAFADTIPLDLKKITKNIMRNIKRRLRYKKQKSKLNKK